MIRGLLAGVSMGTLVSAGVLSVISVLAPQPAGNLPPSPPKVDAPAPADLAPQSDAAPSPEGGVMSDAPALGDVPTQPAAIAELDGAAPVIDTQAGPAPETTAPDVDLVAPQGAAAPQVAATGEEPVFPSPQTLSPEVPQTEADLVIAAAPALVTDVPDAEGAVAVADTAEPPVDATQSGEPSVLAQSPGLATPTVLQDAPDGVAPGLADPEAPSANSAGSLGSDDLAPETAPLADTTPSAPTDVAVTAPGAPADPNLPPGPATLGAPSDPSLAPGTAPGALAIDAGDAAPQSDSPAAPPAGPAPAVGLSGTSAGSLPVGTNTVRVNRPAPAPALPGTDQVAPSDVGLDAGLPQIAPQGTGALERYAAPSPENAEGAALFSVILIDDGSMQGGAAALSAAGVAVTVAIPSGGQDATARMAEYRASGIEVVALVTLPEGAQASDAAVAAEVARNAVPEAVALMQTKAADLAVTSELLAAAGDQGLGMLAPSSGIGGLTRAASAAGVPGAEIYRDLDSEGQDARVIRRFMDQGAFRARQDGSVVLLGRVRPETISALIMWSTANRSDQVLQVPVSVVLKAARTGG